MATDRRIAIVTGAASGIGRAIAIQLARDGFNLALNDLADSHEKLGQVADEVSQAGADVILVPGDVSSEEDVKNVVDATVEKYGRVDAVRS
jgi:NAD(P)-dependent dehydrogenase (short-subunit alcohol dehydrogenase family)